MFPTLVEMFNITGLSNVYIYNMWACKFYNMNKTIILPRDGVPGNRTRVHVLVLEYEYFLSMSTRV